MKKILLSLVVLIGYLGYDFYQDVYTHTNTEANYNYTPVETIVTPTPIKKIQPKPKRKYKCDGRQHCSQMRSYEEAKFFIKNCPNTKMDGDNDGIPCERQFGR